MALFLVSILLGLLAVIWGVILIRRDQRTVGIVSLSMGALLIVVPVLIWLYFTYLYV